MEFGPQREEWDKPFSGKGKRIIKSHTFSYDLDKLKEYGYPIVFVYRPDYECFIKKNEKNITTLEDNYDLLEILKISEPKDFSYRLYSDEDIKVYIWLK